MPGRKLICIFLAAMFMVMPAVFSANTTANNYSKVISMQGGFIIVPNNSLDVNPHSEFATSSFSSSGEFSTRSSFSSREKRKFSNQSFSLRKESDFSSGPTSRPQSGKDISETSLFSISDSEFLSAPSSSPQPGSGEFSNVSSLSSASSFSMP